MPNDTISRQAAIEALEEPDKVPDSWTDEYAVGERAQYEKDVKTLKNLPSAERRGMNEIHISANEDSISREQAIKTVKAYKIFAPTDGVEKTLNAVMDAIVHSIAALPAANTTKI